MQVKIRMNNILSKLLAPIGYLRLKHQEKIWFDFVIPFLISALVVVVYLLLPRPFPLLGDRGLISAVNGLLQVLTGFYIAALAAVATFDKPGMDLIMDGDPPTINEMRKGAPKDIELTRRRFLSYLFGFLSFESLLLFVIGVVLNLLSDSICVWMDGAEYLTGIVKPFLLFIYMAMLGNLVTTTLLGLYYLTVRIHVNKSVIKKDDASEK